jgi:hypothetical protein
MDAAWISMLPLLGLFAFLIFQVGRRVPCPDCGQTLPVFLSPFKKTRRIWRAGGSICTRCGCETNIAGQKVTADTPAAPFPTLQCALLAVGFMIGLGLVATLIVVERTAVAAQPSVIALPPQVPPAVPVD